MTFRALSVSSEADRLEWSALLATLPEQDIHFDPGYIQAYAREEGVEAFCWVCTQVGGLIMQPVMIRGDTVGNVYCYGAALANGAASVWPEMLMACEISAMDWCNRRGIKKLRYRTHPLFREYGDSNWVRDKMIVFMDLAQDRIEDELRKGHKSSVALALKSGVTVEASDDVDLFMDMYRAMLERNQGEDKWKFGASLLYDLWAAYPRGFRLLIAKVNGQPEAGCVLLGAHSTCYYQYAGSFGNFTNIGVGNLLVLAAARWAKEKGFQRLHLGGGLTNDPADSLLRFKAGFSKRRAWCYTYSRDIQEKAA